MNPIYSAWVRHKDAKVRASDGTVLDVFPLNTNDNPRGICFDGDNLWMACSGSNAVVCMSRDGVVLGRYTAGGQPRALCFDGLSMWAANSSGTYIGRY